MKKYAILLVTIFLGLASLSYAQAPVPFINLPLMPDATPPGGADFTLTINGTGFVSNSVVNWNGSPLETQFVSGSQLTATVPASDIATAGTGWVTVVNPAPGGGESNTVYFTATFKTGNSVAFTLASSPAVGNSPYSVAMGDFNGDGKLDVAVANDGSNTVSVLLGDGAGNLTLTSSLTVGVNPWSVAVGDFNGDGKVDLAVANRCGNDPTCSSGVGTVSILLGDGTGKFTLASSPVAGWSPSSVAVGDFNGDGKLDLAVANGTNGNGTVTILLGDGTGNFTFACAPRSGDIPYSVAVGDFNGDGKLDLAVANFWDSTVSILLGDGRGNFTLTSSPSTGGYPQSVIVGDFNGDGKLDLATADLYGNSVSVLLGDGTGNFTLTSSLAPGVDPTSVVVGDFNGDNKPDLAVGIWGNSTVSIWLGDGTGIFTLVSSLPAGNVPRSVAVGDVNGDGTLDLVTANLFDNTISILLGVPLTPAVTLFPGNLTFGTQLVGTSSNPQPMTLTNTGGAPLNIGRVVVSPNFSQTNNCPAQLPPGGQCTANVVFTPRKVNTITGTITITDNAPNNPQTISLTGVATAATLSPSNLDFGNQPAGTTSLPQTVTLTNYSDRAGTIFGGELTGNNSGSFVLQNTTCGSSLPPGGTCTISIAFAPKSAGSKTATLEVRDNGGASPQTVTLSGSGT